MLWAVTLKSSRIETERKKFHFYLQENDRGKFIRITEDVNGRYSSIIVPLDAISDFRKHLDAMVAHNAHGNNRNGNGKNGNGSHSSGTDARQSSPAQTSPTILRSELEPS